MEATLRSAQVLKQEAEDIGLEGKDILNNLCEKTTSIGERRKGSLERCTEDAGRGERKADEIQMAQIKVFDFSNRKMKKNI